MTIKTIPQPDDQNPEPTLGDRWFNYRSMQEIRIFEIAPTRVWFFSASSNKRLSTSRDALKNPRWFKFLEHGSVVLPPDPGPGSMSPKASAVLQDILKEQQRTNALLTKLVQAWVKE